MNEPGVEDTPTTVIYPKADEHAALPVDMQQMQMALKYEECRNAGRHQFVPHELPATGDPGLLCERCGHWFKTKAG